MRSDSGTSRRERRAIRRRALATRLPFPPDARADGRCDRGVSRPRAANPRSRPAIEQDRRIARERWRRPPRRGARRARAFRGAMPRDRSLPTRDRGAAPHLAEHRRKRHPRACAASWTHRERIRSLAQKRSACSSSPNHPGDRRHARPKPRPRSVMLRVACHRQRRKGVLYGIQATDKATGALAGAVAGGAMAHNRGEQAAEDEQTDDQPPAEEQAPAQEQARRRMRRLRRTRLTRSNTSQSCTPRAR